MKQTLIASLIALALTGCASIINGKTQDVTLKSVPDGAAITIVNRQGTTVHSGTTPATVNLKRGYGYFKPEIYTVRFQKEGYALKELTLTGQVGGWYFGNLIIGGLVVGMLIVDPLTGGMYTLSPDKVDEALEAVGSKTSRADGSLTVVMAEDVPVEIMKQARRVN